MAAPMSMALAMALVKSAAEADDGFVRARPEFQSTSFNNGYAALESFLAASPISSANAGAAPNMVTAGMAAGAARRSAGGTKVDCFDAKYASAPMAGTMILPERPMIAGWMWGSELKHE